MAKEEDITLTEIIEYIKERGGSVDFALDMWNKDPAMLRRSYMNNLMDTKKIITNKGTFTANEFVDNLDNIIDKDLRAVKRILKTLESRVDFEEGANSLNARVQVWSLLAPDVIEEEHLIFDGSLSKDDDSVQNAIDATISELFYYLLQNL